MPEAKPYPFAPFRVADDGVYRTIVTGAADFSARDLAVLFWRYHLFGADRVHPGSARQVFEGSSKADLYATAGSLAQGAINDALNRECRTLNPADLLKPGAVTMIETLEPLIAERLGLPENRAKAFERWKYQR